MSRTKSCRALLIVCLLLGLCGLGAPVGRADCPLYRLPTSRFGVDVVGAGAITNYDVSALHIGWYSDWVADVEPRRPGGIEYFQLISVIGGQWSPGPLDVLEDYVDANPGAIWIIGNEPECPVAPGGGSMTPEQYGDVYHLLYGAIKGFDPTAKIAIGGVVQPTPLRLEWLDRLLTWYAAQPGWGPMPVDVWTTHVQILQESRTGWGCGIPVGLDANEGRLYSPEENYSIPIFQELVRDFRVWMNSHGQRDKPLIITEYGVLMPDFWGATIEVVNAYMNASFDFLLNTTDATLGYPADSNHLVQRWGWMSLNDQPYNNGQGYNGSLFDYMDSTFPGTPTAYGLNFMSYTNSLLAGLTGTVCVNGTVQLQASSNHSTTAALTLLPVDCPQPDIRSVTTNASGGFTVCHVLPGTYDVVIKGYNTLASRVNGRSLGSGSSVNLGVLAPGDANNDNKVTLVDFSLLTAAYRTAAGDTAYDHRADFNADGQVNILDFSLLATHYTEVGAQAW